MALAFALATLATGRNVLGAAATGHVANSAVSLTARADTRPDPKRTAKEVARAIRAKRPGKFRYFGSKARYHFDPATSTTNNTKRREGRDFCGRTGQYQPA